MCKQTVGNLYCQPICIEGPRKTKPRKRWRAFQVNLGHFIKNTCHNKERERQSLLSHNERKCFDIIQVTVNIMHQRSLLSPWEYLNICMWNRSSFSSGLLKFWKIQERRRSLPSSALTSAYLERKFKCHIRGNVRALRRGCMQRLNGSFYREWRQHVVPCRCGWGEAWCLPLICSSPPPRKRHQGH